jgi:UDP-N-acetylmuramate--alanine ligase
MKHVHLIGIGGTGLSPIAWVLLERGYLVTGSDKALSPLARSLQEAGVQVFIGHDAANIAGADLVVRSSAVNDDNAEVQAARKAGIPVLKRSNFLGELLADNLSIAVAGTHGKTTTTAMVTWMLTSLKQDPSYIIGGISKNLGRNAHAGKGRSFVIEADEYDNMFLGMQPNIEVITTIEHDHPDCFPTMDDYMKAFAAFIHNLRPGGILLTCQDDRNSSRLVRNLPASRKSFTYGVDTISDYQARDVVRNENGGLSYRAMFRSGTSTTPLASLALKVPGEHNVRNSLAALAVAHQLDLSLKDAAAALSAFEGTGRRFDLRGKAAGITIIDDYAHHPTEIRTTLAAARSRFPGQRIWAVWQPHTYSRTLALASEFVRAFGDADKVIVTDIYAAREKEATISAGDIVKKMNHPSAQQIMAFKDITEFLLNNLQPGDVLLVLSAGDADQISADVLAGLQAHEVKP